MSSLQRTVSNNIHSLRSSYREALLEHLFIGELLRHLWKQGRFVEVLKPQVDDAGYDVCLESNGVIRHVQLKASFEESKTAKQNVHLNLAEKPSGRIVWIRFDTETLDLVSFGWFGGKPGKPLPSLSELKKAKHTKGDGTGKKLERPMIRVIPKARFEEVKTMEELAERLFRAIE